MRSIILLLIILHAANGQSTTNTTTTTTATTTNTTTTTTTTQVLVFRVALISDKTGGYLSSSQAMAKAFKDFVVPAIISKKKGISLGTLRGNLEIVEYDTKSDKNHVATCVNAAKNGLDDSGNSAGEIHMIIAATANLNKEIIAAAQTAGLPNLHIGGDDPRLWNAANTYAFGIQLPFTWYTRDVLKSAFQKGAKTVTILASRQNDRMRQSALAALHYATELGLTVVGPSRNFCSTVNSRNAGVTSCGAGCICGDQNEVSGFGYDYFLSSAVNFYEFNEGVIGSAVQGKIDSPTESFFGSIFTDLTSRNTKPDIIINLAVEYYDVINALWKNVQFQMDPPKVLMGWHNGAPLDVAAAAAKDASGNQVLQKWHVADVVGFNEWINPSSVSNFAAWQSPIWITPAGAAQEFKASRGTDLTVGEGAAAAAGDVLWKATYEHTLESDWRLLTLSQKRDNIRQALGSFQYATMWGFVRFNAKRQNIGRSTLAWQTKLIGKATYANELLIGQSQMKYPRLSSELLKNQQCAAGNYYTGQVCAACPIGKFNTKNVSIFGTAKETACTACSAGKESRSAGSIACTECPAGKAKLGTGVGLCETCPVGKSDNKTGSSKCALCPVGKISSSRGQLQCENCTFGKFAGQEGLTSCKKCSPGSMASEEGKSTCAECPKNTYSRNDGAISCIGCLGGQITTAVASNSSGACACPTGTYAFRPAGEYDDKCISCNKMEGFDCSSGKAPALKGGFYSSPDDPYSALSCIKAGSKCLGGSIVQKITIRRLAEETEDWDTKYCGGGRFGQQCAFCKKGEFAYDGEDCKKCGGLEAIAFPLVLALGVLFVFVCHDLSWRSWSFTRRVSSMMMCVVCHVQMVALLLSINLDLPQQFSQLLKGLQLLLFNMTYLWTNCAYGPELVAMYVPGAVLPLALALLMGLTCGFLGLVVPFTCESKTERFLTWNNVANTLMMIVSGLSVGVFKGVLNIYDCRTNPNAQKTLTHFEGFNCDGSVVKDQLGLTVAMLILYLGPTVVVQSYILIQAPLFFKKNKDFREMFRYITDRWHPNARWFGVVQIVRNLLLCGVTIVATDAFYQIILYACIFGLVFILTAFWFPWKEACANFADVVMSFSIMAILIIGAGLTPNPTDVETVDWFGFMLVGFAAFATFVVVILVIDELVHVQTGHHLCEREKYKTKNVTLHFVQTVQNLGQMAGQSSSELLQDSKELIKELPETDIIRLSHLLDALDSGLVKCSEKPTSVARKTARGKSMKGNLSTASRKSKKLLAMSAQNTGSSEEGGEDNDGDRRPSMASMASKSSKKNRRSSRTGAPGTASAICFDLSAEVKEVALEEGDCITVLHDFDGSSDGDQFRELKQGMNGTVLRIDNSGDAYVDFEGPPEFKQWITKKNFDMVDIILAPHLVGLILAVYDEVEIIEPLESSSKAEWSGRGAEKSRPKKEKLAMGLRGEVQQLDEQGDALIEFEMPDGELRNEWVLKRNFYKLRKALPKDDEERSVCSSEATLASLDSQGFRITAGKSESGSEATTTSTVSMPDA